MGVGMVVNGMDMDVDGLGECGVGTGGAGGVDTMTLCTVSCHTCHTMS